jgi:uncharacterized protein YjbI with pentapeptide repeats
MHWRNIFGLFRQVSPDRSQTKSTLHLQDAKQTDNKKLRRKDVLRFIAQNGGPEGLNLSEYDLSGANLIQLDLHGIILGNLETVKFSGHEAIAEYSAKLEGAWIERSNLRKANFGRVNLRGGSLYQSDLTEATLWLANLELANLKKVNLSNAELYGTNLKDARLDEANLKGANLYKANLRGATFSAESIGKRIIQENKEDYEAYHQRWYTNPHVRDKYQKRNLDLRHIQAAEIYQALKNVFLSSGYYDDASWAYFKEKQMRRITVAPWRAHRYYSDELPIEIRFWSWRYWLFYVKYTMKWILDWMAELSCGYGEKPMRAVVCAFVILLIFPIVFRFSGGVVSDSGQMTWLDYFNYSLGSFTTIGFDQFHAITPLAQTLTSLEALLGISTLALLMFALGKRISR